MTLLELFEDIISQWARHHAGHHHAPYLVRLKKTAIPDKSILDRLLAFSIPEKFYYRAKDGNFILGGLGSALTAEGGSVTDILNGFERLWKEDETVPVLGGFAFFPGDEAAAEWLPFGRFRFTLPFVEFQSNNGNLLIAVNYINKKNHQPRAVAQEIRRMLESLDEECMASSDASPTAVLKKNLLPEKTGWNQMVKKALLAIKAEEMKKIVLARKKIIISPDAWNPARIIRIMAEIKENSFTFFYQIGENIAFLGRSPERLFRLEAGHVLAEAIAGTRPRGKTPREDESLEGELLNSQKELEEHRFVAGYIETAMNGICTEVRKISSEEVLKLKNVQHIITRFTGRSLSNQTPLSIAQALHPTPAVGGYPAESITGYLKAAEPFQRGWYAAPIGWMNKNNADFAVGIRSALINGNSLHLFAGAGIVRQSNAHAEWKETEKKMDNFTAVLGDI